MEVHADPKVDYIDLLEHRYVNPAIDLSLESMPAGGELH